MYIFKRGGTYWFEFVLNGERVRESTKLANARKALTYAEAYRTKLVMGEVGFREKKPVPTLAKFLKDEFLSWAEATFKAKPRTYIWYRGGAKRLSEFDLLAGARLDQITGEKVSAYIGKRQTKSLSVTAINRELQILRRVLRLAIEWGHIEKSPKIKMLPGEMRRERVITPEEEARYLAAAPEPLASIATVLIDSGMRPEECFRLRWESVTWVNGRYGTVLVTHG
jgi:integrase